jgi:crotonobetainyl-CoA:carnitine CoA-transferase CaiB-like acyl-CoA transferase
MVLPIEGTKITDFTGVQAGPACTQLLAWLGANVLKVERPGTGDLTRTQLRDASGLSPPDRHMSLSTSNPRWRRSSLTSKRYFPWKTRPAAL